MFKDKTLLKNFLSPTICRLSQFHVEAIYFPNLLKVQHNYKVTKLEGKLWRQCQANQRYVKVID